ncbi:MAG: YceI family protein [Candidatus Acidiferrales bacterium]
MRKFLLFAVLALVATVPAFAQGASTWQIDPAHTNAQFVVRHLGISNVQGDFTKVSGRISLDDADITKSNVTATIDINSVDTRVTNRDNDLKSPNFFDAAKFPTMTFQSKKFLRGADGKIQMTGDLTLRGVTKEITFIVDGPSEAIKDPWGNTRRGASATTTIRRSDFGITKYPATVIGEDIAITLDVEFIKK